MRSRMRRNAAKTGFTIRKKRGSSYYAHPEERAREIISNYEIRDYIAENSPEKA